MATGDLKYSVEIETLRAQRALSGLTSTINRFGAAIAGAFAFAEFSRAAAKMEDLRKTLQTLYRSTELGAGAFEDTRKLANALGLDIDTLAESVIKLKAAGIEPTAAQLRLFADVAKSSTDAVGTLTAVTDLYTRTMAGGLGLEDLERLQDRGIPVYDLLNKKLGLTRLQLSDFGKSAAGAKVIRDALAEGLQDLFGGGAADRANSLSSAMARFRNSLKDAADALAQSGIGEHLVTIADSTARWISSNKELINQIGKTLSGAFQVFLNNIGIISQAAFYLFVTVLGVKAIQGIKALMEGLAVLRTAMLRHPIMALAVAMTAAAAALGLLDPVLEKITDSFNKIGDTPVVKVLDDTKQSADELANSNGLKVFKDGTVASGTKDWAAQVSALNDKLNIFKREMASTVEAFALYNKQQRDALDLETSLIGATSEEIALRQAQADITRKAADEIQKLREEKAKLTEEQKKEGRGEIIDSTIKKIEEQAEKDKELTAVSIKNSQDRLRARQVELFEIQNRISFEDKLMGIQRDMAQITMTDIEKKYDDITRAANESALAAIRAEEARLGRRLDSNEQKKYYDEAAKYNEVLRQQQKALYEESRRFETGWTKAFKSYKEDATNAAKTAERIFETATKGMEDALVEFAKTGKTSFRGLINTMIEELYRAEIRKLMANVFNIGGSSGGGGSLLGSIGNILGFANGGIIPTNSPVLVGERGPELISGAAGRNVTPNEQLGLGTTNVIYNISAVDARSFKELVAADPSFIYAVTEQGRKTIPGGRR
jgi:lambda family phage tail tape measure protein